MILATHILSGAAIGANVKNPYLVAILSIVLHFLIDLFPHGDYLNKKSKLREFWKVIIDLMIGIGMVLVILFAKNELANSTLIRNIAIGIFFSLLPDVTTFLCHWMKVKFFNPIYEFHQKLHLINYPDFAPEREFGLKNNLWDIVISFLLILLLIITS